MGMISRPTGPTGYNAGFFEMVGGVFMIGFAGVAIWALFVAAKITLASVAFIFVAHAAGLQSVLWHNVLANAISGLFAGIAVAIVQRWWGKRAAEVGEPALEALFVENIVLDGIVGFAIGALNGSGGVVSFGQLLFGHNHASLHGDFYPLTHALLFGGAGGAGSGGFDPSWWWALLCFLCAIVAMALLAGFILGPLLQVLLAGLGGGVRGGVASAVDRAHPVAEGIKRGLQVGLAIGLIEAGCSAWAYWTYHHVDSDRTGSTMLRGLSFAGEQFGLLVGEQVVDDRTDRAVHDAADVAVALVDPVIGHAVLREIVGSNLLRAIAGPDLAAP